MDSFEQKATRGLLLAALVYAGACVAGPVWAQQAARQVGASMVQRPQPPASGVNARNPDNMPIKRPRKPTHDPISRRPPASSVQPK